MARFLAGLVIGMFAGSTTLALAAKIEGSGYLYGWVVTSGGKIICTAPTPSTPKRLSAIDTSGFSRAE